MPDLYLAIDQGTSATKACVFEAPARLVGQATVPVARRSPEPGAMIQDPDELVQSCSTAATGALREASVDASELCACGLANTGESFVLFEPGRGAVTPVIGWQDSRAGRRLKQLAREGRGTRIKELTGLPLHAEFTAPKLDRWLRAIEVTHATRFGTLDTWLIHRLSHDAGLVTDRATASRTMLVALAEDTWSDELLADFNVPTSVLAEIRPCDAMEVSLRIDGVDVPLAASGYDMGLALLGHACLRPGETKATFGTCLGVMAASDVDTPGGDALLTAIAYTREGRSAYGLDGEIASAGALVHWAIELGLADSAEHLDASAAAVEDASGAIIVPAFGGLGAPHWRDDVDGRILGLSAAVGRRELCRAIYDAIAFSLADVATALGETGLSITAIQVDGGLAQSRTLMQLCADACGLPLVRVAHTEATALGAAALAMLATDGTDPQSLQISVVDGAEIIEPQCDPDPEVRARWREAIASTLES